MESRRSRIHALALTLLLAPAACVSPTHSPPSDAAAVYAALLDAEFVGPETRQLVVRATRELNHPFGDTDLWQELEAAQTEATPLSEHVPAAVPVRLLTDAELDDLRSTPWGFRWEPFFEAFPHADGLITVSAVGFDAGRERALVQAYLGCGGRCGHGGAYVLQKSQGKWLVTEHVYLIQS